MRSNIQIETGTYTGNGGASREIPTARAPDVVFTKRINGAATGMLTRWGRRIPRNIAFIVGSGSGSAQANQIQELTADGFVIGSGQNQNTALYAYLALSFGEAKHVWQDGVYYGTGVDGLEVRGDYVGTEFLPDYLTIVRATAGYPMAFRTAAHSGDAAQTWTGTQGANVIQTLESNGFTVGTATSTNGVDYFYWLALKQHAGMVVGSYTGTGAEQTIETGFQPAAVFVKARTAADAGLFLSDGMVANGIKSIPVSAAAEDTAGITALTSQGFTVGTSAGANAAAAHYVYMAFAAGSFNAPWTRPQI